MDDLIRKLTKDLGVDRTQARGGLVALLRAGQKNLNRTDFQSFLNDMPGAEKLLASSPPPTMLSSLAGGFGSLLGNAAGGAGRWAGLAAAFTELGVDLDTAKKFGPIVIEYVREHGGEDLVDKVRAALKL